MQTIKCHDAILLSFMVLALLMPYTYCLPMPHYLLNFAVSVFQYFCGEGYIIFISIFLIFFIVCSIVLNKKLDKARIELDQYKKLLDSFPPVTADGNKIAIEDNSVYEYISALMQTERKLRKSAEALNNQKTRFLSNVSHEIRTPLNGIIGFTELLEHESDEGERMDMLKCIKTCGKELLSLVNELLDLSKIESGMVELENSEYDIESAVKEALSIIKPLADAKDIDTLFEIKGKISHTIISDRHRYKEVVINLLGNALKFTETGFIKLSVEIKKETADAYLIETSVSDTGKGIRHEDLNKIFIPFMQVKGSDSGTFGGTGLGLPISNEIVKMLGGQGICVKSVPNAGSEFTFLLKFQKGAAIASESGLTAPKNDHDEYTASRNCRISMKILVADDNQINLKLVKKILEDNRHQAVLVKNGREAVEAAKLSHFDLILMDVNMPEMNGYNAALEIRRLGIKTPIVAMTASAMKEDVKKCENSAMSGFISKPIDVASFLSIVESYSKNSRVPPKNPAELESEAECLNLDVLSRNVKGDRELIKECLKLFFSCIENEKNDLCDSIRDGDRDNSLFLAHKMKGSALAVGAEKISKIAAMFENVPQESFGVEAEKIFSALCDEIKKCKNLIAEKLMD